MTFSLAFLTRSNAISFARENDSENKTTDYCLNDCSATFENIVWVLFKRMCGKLFPNLRLLPSKISIVFDSIFFDIQRGCCLIFGHFEGVLIFSFEISRES